MLTSGSGNMNAVVEDKEPHDFRVACYPDGSKKIQGAYQWSKGTSWGVAWRDLPMVYVDATGQERGHGCTT